MTIIVNYEKHFKAGGHCISNSCGQLGAHEAIEADLLFMGVHDQLAVQGWRNAHTELAAVMALGQWLGC